MLDKAHEYYERANANPTAYSLVNDGNLFLWQDQTFKGITALSDANSIMPGSGPILNNLGFAYSKVHGVDSLVKFLGEAMDHTISKDAAHTNFFGMAVIEQLPIDADSIVKKLKATSTGAISNAMLLASLAHQPFETTADRSAANGLTWWERHFLIITLYITPNHLTLRLQLKLTESRRTR